MALAVASLVVPGAASASRGDVDGRYGDAGAAVFDNLAFPLGSLVASDSGAVFFAGQISGRSRSTVVKVKPNGRPDLGFGDGGRALAPRGAPTIRDLAVDSHGRPVVVVEDYPRPNLVARFRRDGSLDTRFGTDGLVQMLDPYSVGIATDSRDRVLIAFSERVIRLERNGSFDADGPAGFQYPGDFTAGSLEVDPHDRPLLLGHGIDQAEVIRLTDSLTLDTSFGIAKPRVAGSNAESQFSSLDSEGGLWATGVLCASRFCEFSIDHVKANGTLARAFRQRVNPDFLLAADRGGVIVGGDLTYGPYPYTSRVTRLTHTGRIDHRWGLDGSAFPYVEGRRFEPDDVKSTAAGTFVAGDMARGGVAVVHLSNERGHPDADGDGVPDRKDHCVTLPDLTTKTCKTLDRPD